MKKVNFVKRFAQGAFCALAAMSILLISSCKKEESTTPETAPSSTVLESKLKASYAATVKKSAFTLASAIKYQNKSNLVIKGDSINGGSSPCIYLINCTNVHITRCKLMNSKSFGIYLNNCSNILIDSCLISNVAAGVYAEVCPGGQIRVMSNQMQNMQGPYPHADFVQFNRVGGTYNRICYNKLENVQGKSNPEDGINTYMSNGTASDPIYIVGNMIRGGGPSTTGAGICAGDNGGSYQIVENNTLVNCGYGGIDYVGGSHITVKGNSVYSASFKWSGCGLGCSNFTTTAASGNTYTGNRVNWTAGMWGGYVRDTVYRYSKLNPMPSGWKSNTVRAAIGTSLLPTVLIDYK